VRFRTLAAELAAQLAAEHAACSDLFQEEPRDFLFDPPPRRLTHSSDIMLFLNIFNATTLVIALRAYLRGN